MTSALSTLVVRLFGAYCIFTGIYVAADYFASFGQNNSVVDPETGWHMLIGIYAYATLAVTGLGLWIFARRLSGVLIGRPTSVDQAMEAEDLIAAGTFIIGLYWAATHMPQAIYLEFVLREQFGDPETALPWINVAVGIAMMIGMRPVVSLFRILRTLGRSAPQD